MKAVTEAGNDLALRGNEGVQTGLNRIGFAGSGVDARGNVLLQLDHLLASAAVDVAEHVDC